MKTYTDVPAEKLVKLIKDLRAEGISVEEISIFVQDNYKFTVSF